MSVKKPAAKKPYTSALRAEQAQATRRAIVAAAADLFTQLGYGGTSVDAIAERAGVSRKTVFTSVGGKLEALKLALDWALVGDDQPVPVLERAHVHAALVEPDARVILAGFVDHVLEVMPRVAALHGVLSGVAGLDPELRALHDDLNRQRFQGMTFLAALLSKRGALRPGLRVADTAQLLCLLNEAGVYTRLVVEHGWSRARFRTWLAETAATQLLDPRYRPAEA